MTAMWPTDFKQFIEIMADVIGDDRSQAERFAFAIKKACPQVLEVWKNLGLEKRALNPFPAFETITAAQCTLFDNWKHNGGRKPKTVNGKREKGARAERYKVTVECWTIDPAVTGTLNSSVKLTENNAAFKATAHLMDGPTLKKKVDDLRSPKKTKRPFAQLDPFDDAGAEWQAFGDHLRAIAADMTGLRIGPVFSVGDGTRWHIDTIAVAQQANLDSRDELTVAFRSPVGDYAFTEWSTTYPNGSPLRGNAILTSRVSNLPSKRFWVTTGTKP